MLDEKEGGPIEISNATASSAVGSGVPIGDVFRIAAESLNLKPAQNKTFAILKVGADVAPSLCRSVFTFSCLLSSITLF